MIKTILIPGGTGFIGSHLLPSLLTNRYKVIVVKRKFSDLTRIKKFIPQIKIYDIDECNLALPFQKNKIDLVINLAVDQGKNKNSLPSQIMDTNIVFALRLIEKCCAFKIKYYFNFDSALNDNINLYAYSKHVLYSLLKKYSLCPIKIFNLELQYVYGKNDDPKKFIPFAIDKLRSNKVIKMTQGKQNLDFIYIKDCVDAILHLIQNCQKFKKIFEEFQIGTGKTMFLKNLVKIIKNNLHSHSRIIYGAVPYRQNEQMFSRANIKKLKGWKPKYKPEDVDFKNFT
ncbi:MAG: NAD-dependent epimerase/dehydratase [Candidatus Doudnabacteria bacterium]